MKNIVKLPKTKIGWGVLFLICSNVLLGTWPIISFFNNEVIIFGLPLLGLWSYAIAFLGSITMLLAMKLGVEQ